MPMPHSDRPRDVSRWLRDHFIGSFINEGHPAHWPPEMGFFAIPLLSLTYANAAAALLLSRSQASSLETIDFLAAELGRNRAPSYRRYRAYPTLLYTLFRHGLVHRRAPGQLKVKAHDGTFVTVGWQLHRSTPRKDHLRLFRPGELFNGRRLGPAQFALSISVDLLFRDTLGALRHIRTRVSQNSRLARQVYRGVALLEGPRRPVDKRTTEPQLAAELTP